MSPHNCSPNPVHKNGDIWEKKGTHWVFIQLILSYKHALIGSNPENQLGILQPNTNLPRTLCLYSHCYFIWLKKKTTSEQTGSSHRCHNAKPMPPLTRTWGWVHPTVSDHLGSPCSNHLWRINNTGRRIDKRIRTIRAVVVFRDACIGNRAFLVSQVQPWYLGLMPDYESLPSRGYNVVNEAWNTTIT